MSTSSKFDAQADRWTETAYDDPVRYLARRARLVRELGPPLRPGDRVLDLACGDAGFAEPLLAAGLAYEGVDASGPMAAAAARRLGDRGRAVRGDLDTYRPAEPVAATVCFRAIYYARDRRAWFRHVASYTERKLVFDLNPRQYRVADVLADLRAAGFGPIELRPFFVPQQQSLPRPALWALAAAERAGPLARLLLRFRFSYVVSAASPRRR